MYKFDMSSKSDEDQVIVEKIRNYPDLTVNDCSPSKILASPQNVINVQTASVKNINRSNHPISIVPTSGGQNFDPTHTTCAELRQAIERNKLPPYTNVCPKQAANRGNKVNQSKTPPKTTPQKLLSYENPISESSISPQTILSSKSVTIGTRTISSLNSVPVSRTVPTSIQQKNDKITLIKVPSPSSESNCATSKVTQDQIVQPQASKSSNDILERNIHKNVLSLTPFSSSSKSIPVTTETKVLPVTAVPKTTSPTPKNSAPVKDDVNFNSSPKFVGKSDVQSSSPNNVKLASSNNTSKPLVISTSELSRNLFNKPSNVDINVNSSSNDLDSRNTDINSKNIPPKTVPSTISSFISKINPQTTTISVTSNTAVQLKKPVISEAPVQMPVISSISENKEIMHALSSGSNINLRDSVSIFPKGTDSKMKSVASSNSGNFRSKSGNAEIVGGGNPNPSGSSPKQSSSPSASRELRSAKKESITFTQKSPGENEDVNPENRQKDAARLDSEDTDNLLPSRKLEESGGVVECLTISSDEEEAEESEPHVSSHSDSSDISSSLMNKEPPLIDAYNDAKLSDSEMNMDDRESEAELDVISGPGYTNLTCRTVRIGSYKFLPISPVVVSEHGVRIDVPAINRPSENVVVKIPTDEIEKVLIHSGRKLPVMFYYVTMQMGVKVRSLLNMTSKSECYFNPHSRDDSQRRITLVLEKFSESSVSCITEMYLDRNLLEELSLREANELLVRSSPRERKDVQKIMKQVPPNPVQTIMVYPPPPARGGISINTEDYSCLAEDVFLNDVIIDFYLKWLYNEKLSDEDKAKTHIFSSFFYKRLTDKATPIPRDLQNSRASDAIISPAEIRHSRVSKWTKNIDLFSKDYIIIPLNENQHWFLAIICFPGLNGPVRFADNKPIETLPPEVKVESADSSSLNPDSQTMFIGSTSITPIRPDVIPKFATTEEEGGDAEERDEADGTEEDVNLYLPNSEDSDAECSETDVASSGDVKPPVSRIKTEKEPIKQPCILVFDSLAGASRARIIATLRDYLRVEYKVKHNEERDFSKFIVKGACPRVPQQNNYTDCGLFVLQYVESFFANKITNFHVPIKSLRNWFDPDIVGRKRSEIQRLLLQLMMEQNIDVEGLNLPRLNLSPHSDDDSSDEYDDRYEDEDDYYDEEDMDDEDLEEDGDIEEEGDGDLEHPFDYRSRVVLDEMGDDAEVGGRIGAAGHTFRAAFRRPYRHHDDHHRHHRRQHQHQHGHPGHGQQLSVAGDEPEYEDDDEDIESYGQESRSHFEIYGAEFEMDQEDSHDEEGGDVRDPTDETDIYHGLDDDNVVDVMKARKDAVGCAMASRIRCASSGGRTMPSGGGSRLMGPSASKTLQMMRPLQLVNYDDDDDEEEDPDVMDDEIGGGSLVDDDDDEEEDVEEDDEGEGLQHVDDEEEDGDEEDVQGLGEIVEGDGEDDEEALKAENGRRLAALANERLCALNPDTVTVSLTRRRTVVPSKDSNPCDTANVTTTSSSSSAAGPSVLLERSQLAALKAARPFGDVDSADSQSSVTKRFRTD